MIKSIQGKVAKKQDTKRPNSYKAGSQRQQKARQSDLEISQAAHGFPKESRDFLELYERYSESRVTLLPVEPYLIHAYWEVSHNDIEKAKKRLGNDYKKSQAVLRFYDVTNIIFDGTNAHGTFDVDIDLQSKNWYIDLWSPDKSYFVDLGFKTSDGFFLPITRSNVARTPCAWPAPESGEVAEDTEEGLPKIEIPEEPIRDNLIESERAKAGLEIRKAGHQKEKGLPDEDKSARTIDLPHGISRKSSGPREVRIREKSPFKPELPLPQTIQSRHERGIDFDLTEWSERGFSLGISSGFISSTQGKKNPTDGS